MRIDGNGGRAVAATGSVDLPETTARTPEDTVWARRAAALEAAAPAWTRTPAPVPRPVTAPTPVATPTVTAAVAVPPAGPFHCDVCRLIVAAEYVARTGQIRHKPCQAKVTVTATAREVA